METVQVVNAGQVQYYSFANPPNSPSINSTTAIAFSNPIPKDGIYSTHEAMVTGTGTVGATVLVQATNDPYTAGQDDIANRKFQNFAMTTTNSSTAVTLNQPTPGYFRPDQTGNQVYAAGVPNGTTFTYVSPTSGTLSAAATASGTVPARFQANKWVLLGTITLTGTTEASDGMATAASWKWTRMNVTAISGTGATVVGIQGN
jgi:CHASE2 domain-containing sensor protein